MYNIFETNRRGRTITSCILNTLYFLISYTKQWTK